MDQRDGRIGSEATECAPYDLHWNQTSERDVARMGDSRSVEGREDNVDHVEAYERLVSSPTCTQFKTGSQASLFLRGSRLHMCCASVNESTERVKIPKNVTQALLSDKENGSTLWRDAICQEMMCPECMLV
jgi:hypothetical protein